MWATRTKTIMLNKQNRARIDCVDDDVVVVHVVVDVAAIMHTNTTTIWPTHTRQPTQTRTRVRVHVHETHSPSPPPPPPS